MLNWKILAVATALTSLCAASAQAQVETDPVARLNQLGRHIGRATVCQEFGFEVHSDRVEALANDAIAIGVRAGFSEELSGTYVQNANRFSMAVEDKAIAYFDFWKQKGRDSMSDLDLDATQCNRLLTTRAAALKAAAPKPTATKR